MQKGHLLHFTCERCTHEVAFSVFETSHTTCLQCGVVYDFEDETLQRQLKKFEALCRQIYASQEILSSTSIGVRVGEKEVQIPYKILMSRFNSSLELKLDGRPMTIQFRVEPTIDAAPFSVSQGSR